MERNQEKQKPILIWNVLFATLCTLQATFALTVSTKYVERWWNPENAGMQIWLHVLGAFLLFLLLLTIVLISKRPLLSSIVWTVLLNVLAIINFYEQEYHGTVTTVQDVRNIKTVTEVIGEYSFQLESEIYYMLMTLLIVIFVAAFFFVRETLI